MNRILIAPLNWGLGHATRCIPIIDALLQKGEEVVIASDGQALELLKKEYPQLIHITLPSYDIQYPKKGSDLKWKLLKNSPKILKAIKTEHNLVAQLINSKGITGIISDNRFGVYSSSIPSVIITHQLKVLSGHSTWLSTIIHSRYIKKFDAVWVPDLQSSPNLSGDLGHPKSHSFSQKYLGVLSRMQFEKRPKIYDLMVILSGPEPQRSILDQILFKALQSYPGRILFVKGQIQSEQKWQENNQMTMVNFMTGKGLQNAMNESELIIARSGYSTVMDLVALRKKAFFIPTPGQYEQEYLANKFEEEKRAPFCVQDKFQLNQLERITQYSGFIDYDSNSKIKELLRFFESK